MLNFKNCTANAQNGIKYLQLIYLIRNLYPDYIKNSHNSKVNDSM